MKYLRRQSGYSLLEVMAATTILLVGVLAVSGILMRGYKAMNTAESRSAGLHSTQKEIEAAIQNEETDDEVLVEKIYPYYMRFEAFDIEVKGTLITVKRITPGLPEGEVTYVTFVPDEGYE